MQRYIYQPHLGVQSLEAGLHPPFFLPPIPSPLVLCTRAHTQLVQWWFTASTDSGVEQLMFNHSCVTV